jgi:serine/tyrosine/threonine adenylyltransferase
MNLVFDNSFARELPADPELSNRRRQVHGACYSRVLPTKVHAPYLLAHSREVAELLGLSEQVSNAEFAEVFSGNQLLPEMAPLAACYGGYQFGNWAGQLGDGRAISLGEVIAKDGSRQELQLKGAGPTPYSRQGDGRAVVRSSVREFLCSEAMFHLGVPTTRALCLVGTGEQVVRDMLYDGNARAEPGAVVCRVAPSFVRFGNFEIFAQRGELDTLRALADYVLRRHFPELGEPSQETYARWFDVVCERTALLVAHWMRIGFVHGVLNTDNMSILGLTIDYGPYGWVDNYDPHWTPNTTDASGRRYRFAFQPRIAGWNLMRLGEALLPLVNDVDRLNEGLQKFVTVFEQRFAADRRLKLGLSEVVTALPVESADDIAADLDEVLQLTETDMTLFYRCLARVDVSAEALAQASDEQLVAKLSEAHYEKPSAQSEARLAAWLRRYIVRTHAEPTTSAARRLQMNAVNPKYVLRNYLAQLAIDQAEKGDGALVQELLDVLRNPYAEQPGKTSFAEKRPDWARHRVGCSMLSCSS